MLEMYRKLIANQYESVLCMLSECINRCPDENWNQPVANLQFCQTVFHALIYTDTYLGKSFAELKEQPFHRTHANEFADYEELEDRPQKLTYERAFLRTYLDHCRDKARKAVDAETEESLKVEPGFDWLPFSRAEVHVYNIRHIHHHAAQLSLRLRLDTGDGAPWLGNGWREH